MPWPKTSGAATCKRCAHPCLCNNLFNTKLLALDLAWHWHINELLLEHRMAEQGLQQGEPVGSCQSLQQSFAQYRKKRLQRRAELLNNPVLALPCADPARMAFCREQFVMLIQKYIGVPYSKKHHDLECCSCEGCTEAGRQLRQDPFALDCCGLVRKVVREMSDVLGFWLGHGNQAYQFDTLPMRVESVFQLEPGDLIFYSGIYLNPDAKRQNFDMTHVEIFIGGETGEETVGSRDRYRWVKKYPSYVFQAKRWKLLQHHYVKIDTWLQGICKPANPDLWKSHAHTTGGEIPTQELNWDSTRCSVFRPAAQSQGQGQAGEGWELGDDASGDDD